jgi:UDP-glucose:glycoprotein glucosyltransferase
MRVTAIVDPVTETAQRLSPLLRVLRDELKLPLNLILAPRMLLDGDSKIPIASYYRFVADPSAYQGHSDNSPMAHFSNLPPDHTLTVRMDVPEPWDIQQTQVVQDTDNLRCDLQSGCSDDAASGKTCDGVEMYQQRHLTSVEYGLNHLLFFGQCYDVRGSPPNGLQLTISKHKDDDEKASNESSKTHSQEAEIEADGSVRATSEAAATESMDDDEDSIYSDTLVMKNVGYWQLRANPGVWDLNVAKNSKGAEIFDMFEGVRRRGAVAALGPNQNNNTKRLIMGDFVSHSETLLVKRKPGQEKTSLFSPVATTGMIKKEEEEEEEVINVFSLATGHLYERFLKIMMLSVTKRTSSKVKFWLFENFLSPSFKASAIAMAEKIGCDVEFVTYKWPEWLRGQSEKQRIIWGYKILFLDVLFPLNVKKIIYVDADQVVRGDLKELWDMDLQGAPYGYTPFCTSRETTLGFQFWRTGFWEKHLRGRPYHISALYVVDLERFRKTLVGDQLRSIYQQLSADPGSLANLDQDLPNYAQDQVPIFSLPQEWLWCETWCSDETKPDAKTIDLCNNPLHKEPKVSMAKRVISGELFPESWVELDAEVEMYEKEYVESI